MDMEIFNPLDKRNLGVSIADAIFKQKVYPLNSFPSFNGAGIYAIYYKGDFPLYKNTSEKNIKDFIQPIYAGKAIPEGGRKSRLGLDVPMGEYLYKWLNEHRKSIEAAENLNIDDFYCRFLVVDDIWIHWANLCSLKKQSRFGMPLLTGLETMTPEAEGVINKYLHGIQSTPAEIGQKNCNQENPSKKLRNK
jgi:hypothetical protein